MARAHYKRVKGKANPSKRKVRKRVAAALKKYVRGAKNPTRLSKLYDAKVPATAFQRGYLILIRAKTITEARKAAVREIGHKPKGLTVKVHRGGV